MERTIINSQVFAHVLCVKLTSLSNNLCEKRKEVVKYTVINRLTIICYFIRAICVPITKAKFPNFRLTSLIVNEFSVSRVSLIFDTLSEEKKEEQEGIYFIRNRNWNSCRRKKKKGNQFSIHPEIIRRVVSSWLTVSILVMPICSSYGHYSMSRKWNRRVQKRRHRFAQW